MPPSFFRDAFPNTDPDAPGRIGVGGFYFTFILGVAVRLFACLNTDIINPDGIYYIHQAKVIYFAEWNGLTSCHLNFASVYPFFISGAYVLFREWVAAAQFVSLFFGSATLLALYFLCRHFFDRDTSILSLLLFALLPLFVSGSAEVIRDPVCWFFLALGLYFFVISYERDGGLSLLFSSLCFMMASWARIESALFIIVSLVYLCVIPQRGRIRKATFFALPLMGVLVLIFLAGIFLDQPLNRILRLHDILDKLPGPALSYQTLRADLAEWMRQPLHGVMPYFLHSTRQMVWLVALGTVVKYMIRAYFYLFFILFVLGLGATWRRLREDASILYLSLMAVSVFGVLYLHVIQTWMMFDRFWAIFMLPAVMVVGFGLQKSILLLTNRCRLNKSTAISLLALLILSCTMPKDLKSREADKIVYKAIGELIAQREGNATEIRIAKSLRTPDWASFYANLNYRGAACPRTDFGMEPEPFDEAVFKDHDVFIGYLKRHHIAYFLWEEKAWPQHAFHVPDQEGPEGLLRIGSWHHSDAGKIVLFSVTP